MISSNPMSMRMAAAAGSLALAISAIAAPVALAQDADYQPTLDGLSAAIEAKDFEGLPMYFCEEQAAEMGGLDLASMEEGMPEGMDSQMLLDAIDFHVDITSSEEVSRTAEELVVSITGSMEMEINEEAIGPFIEALLSSMGEEEITADMVAMFSGLLMSQLPTEATDITSDLTAGGSEEETETTEELETTEG
jgi:hypothetical protein